MAINKRKTGSVLPAPKAQGITNKVLTAPKAKATTTKRTGARAKAAVVAPAAAPAAAAAPAPAAAPAAAAAPAPAPAAVPAAASAPGPSAAPIAPTAPVPPATPAPTTPGATVGPSSQKKKAEPKLQWKNDACQPGQPSSLTVLLAWLTEVGNYEKWKGSEGDTQMALATDLSQGITEAKTKVDRSPSAICEKIKSLESSFRQANDFRLGTGQGVIDQAEASEEPNRAELLRMAAKSVEEAIMNICPHYYDLAEVMGDRISKNPKGSYSTTAKADAAGSLLRLGVLPLDDDSSDEEQGQANQEQDDPDEVTNVGETEEEPKTGSPSKKKVKAEQKKGRASDTGRKFGKMDTTTESKRKVSALEAALEHRSQEKTKMDSELNAAKVKAERIGTIMALARELREADYTLSFSDSMEQAKELYADM